MAATQAGTTPAAEDAKLHRRLALEAVRASVLAVHSSVGLVWPIDRGTARLLRSAESLCRSAAAVLASSALGRASAEPSAAAEEKMVEKKVPKRKAKKKKEKQRQQEKEGDQDVAMGEATTMDNLTANLPPGGSLVIGDLSEFGVEDGVLSIPGSGRPSSSPPVSGLGKGCSGSKGVVAGEGLGTASVAPLAALGGPLGREDVQAGRAASSLSPPASVVSSSGGQRFRCQSCRSWHHERFFAFTPSGARSKLCRNCSDNWEGFES